MQKETDRVRLEIILIYIKSSYVYYTHVNQKRDCFIFLKTQRLPYISNKFQLSLFLIFRTLFLSIEQY